MQCQHCQNMALKNWSTERTEHVYCPWCGTHYHNGTWYTKQEWFFYINEEAHALRTQGDSNAATE